MSKIGNLGNLIVFKVSDDKILTFQNLKHTVSGRWAKHTPIWGKPACEFQGADLDAATLTIQLDASLGVKPKRIINNIETAVRTGKKLPFVVGGKRIITGYVVITQASESYEVIMRHGEIYQASVDITLMQYN